MNLTDAARRVLLHHVRLIVACVLLGLIGAAAVATLGPSRYTSSARVMLVDPVSEAPEAFTAVTDAARAMVTSQGFVEGALVDVGVQRSAATLRQSIQVEPIGSSSALEITVTDGDPAVAASVANALSRELVRQWPDASGGAGSEGAGFLTERINAINANVDRLNGEIEELAAETTPRSVQPEDLIRREQRRALMIERGKLVQLRLALETELNSMLAETASRVEPLIIDRAAPPAEADPSNTIPIMALGMLMGGIAGIGAAASIESVRPTLVGAGSIADELGVPVLGQLPKAHRIDEEQITRLAWSMRLAAASAEADTVELFSVEPWDQLSRLQEPFRASSGTKRRGGKPDELVVHPFGTGRAETNGHSNGQASTALVAVLPSSVRRSRLREVQDLRRLTTWPLIGIVTYTPTLHPAPRAGSNGAGNGGSETPDGESESEPKVEAPDTGAPRAEGSTGNGATQAKTVKAESPRDSGAPRAELSTGGGPTAPGPIVAEAPDTGAPRAERTTGDRPGLPGPIVAEAPDAGAPRAEGSAGGGPSLPVPFIGWEASE